MNPTPVEDFFSSIADYIVLSGIIPIAIFLYRYLRYSNWKDTPEGRAIMIQKWSFFAVFALIIIGLFVPDLPFRGYLRFLAFGAVVSSFWLVLVTLIQTQRFEKRRKADIRQRIAELKAKKLLR